MRRLVVVSNRVARRQTGREGRGQGASGGLAVAVSEALQESAGLWFGWSGDLSDRPELHVSPPGDGLRYGVVTADLRPEDYEGYYNGFANRALWPALHYCPSQIDGRGEHYRAYARVNALFAGRLASALRPDDLVWVHDYHLMLMPEELRQRDVTQPIGFFLHTPFPPPCVFAGLPHHRDIVRGLCHADLVGFQTPTDLRAFHDYIREEAGGRVLADGRVEAFGRTFRAGCFPISIDAEALARTAAESGQSQVCRRLARSLDQRRLILGVDRLDYSKGLPQRFLAYEHLLHRYPETRRGVTFVQIAAQSRSSLPDYVQIRRELEELTGRINGRFSDIDWVPLRYISRGLPREMLAGVLRHARVGLVTPLRDGMNLVAKEFIAAQDPECPGVLVLSRFAGAAHELDAALIVNPFDHEETAETMRRALVMPLEERRERWETLMNVILTHDVTRWWRSFVAELSKPVSPRVPEYARLEWSQAV